MALFRWAQAQLAAKVEGSEGTAEDLAAADATIKAENIVLKTEAPFHERNASSASLSQFKGTKGTPILWRATYEIPIVGSGAAGTAPSFSAIMKSALHKEYPVVSTSVAYTPDSDAAYHKSITLGIYPGGKRYLAHGARSNIKFSWPAGDVPKLLCETLGVWNKPTDTNALSGITYESTGTYELCNGVFTVGGTTGLLFRSLDLDMGNVLVVRKILATGRTSGAFSIAIARRNPKGTLVLEEELAATKDLWDIWNQNTEQEIVIGPVGPAAGNYARFKILKAQVMLPDLTNEEDLLGLSLSYKANRNSDAGNDEYELLFT